MKRLLLILFVFALVGFAVYNNLAVKGTQSAQQPAAASPSADSPAAKTPDSSLLEKPLEGYKAPSFSLKALDGKTYRLSGARNKPLVLNFWASWCGPCRLEAPALVKMYQTHKDQVDFYAVNLTSQDRLEEAKAFVKGYGLPFPILLDEKGDVAKRYQLQGIPTTFFVDASGVIRYKILGSANAAAFEQGIAKLLGK